MRKTALYPGSFDPLTNGHLDIINRGLAIFDNIIVGVAVNSRKAPLFSAEERVEMIKKSIDSNKVNVETFEGLTIKYALNRKVSAIIRGLRAVADFEYELQMANMNLRLDPRVETLFMMTSEEYFFVSSGNVKEVASLGGNIKGLVPEPIRKQILKKLLSEN